ncbi:hypothetical protein P7K49_025583 [Saguinus oedipus]|uniref:Uncharacterized protein n=1 Tax=Saguinus oedipus TaxID=9490 RepID=A0ABQ9UIA8_SAGOE|nr:hypothetical protein P7K49_025583 [Saguinus oedipus]
MEKPEAVVDPSTLAGDAMEIKTIDQRPAVNPEEQSIIDEEQTQTDGGFLTADSGKPKASWKIQAIPVDCPCWRIAALNLAGWLLIGQSWQHQTNREESGDRGGRQTDNPRVPKLTSGHDHM